VVAGGIFPPFVSLLNDPDQCVDVQGQIDLFERAEFHGLDGQGYLLGIGQQNDFRTGKCVLDGLDENNTFAFDSFHINDHDTDRFGPKLIFDPVDSKLFDNMDIMLPESRGEAGQKGAIGVHKENFRSHILYMAKGYKTACEIANKVPELICHYFNVLIFSENILSKKTQNET
jgi:hypothetical protein